MASKHSVGRAWGCGSPREWATTARQKGLPSDAKRASDGGEEERGEEAKEEREGEEEGEEEEAEEEEGEERHLSPSLCCCCCGQGAL